MNAQYSDDEDKLISWIKDNYKNLFFGILLGFISIFSYKFIIDSKSTLQHEISFKFEEAVKHYKNNNFKELYKISDNLTDKYPNNIYTSMLNFYAAKAYHDNENYDQSLYKLKLITNNVESPELKILAEIRIARILILQKKYNEAESFIKSNNGFTQNPLMNELLGDISYIKGEKKNAIRYYESILQSDLPPNKIKIIESKINSIK
tara:strand:+ start:2240 stop:2857 length:618 start_codon:yes stop_codon:yes gene_type:complete